MMPSNSNTNSTIVSSTNIVVVLSGPSGAGKDITLDVLKKRPLQLTHITTNTTRPKRQNEIEGEHYHFLSTSEFEALISENAFLEYATVYGNYYGVPKAPIRQALRQGQDIILKLDVQGAMTIKKNLPEAILLFLMPPSLSELEKRLRGRGTESDKDLALRLNIACSEMEMSSQFDYTIVSHSGRTNDTVDEIVDILTAEKRRALLRTYHL